MPRLRSRFGVHPTLEDALSAVPEDELPDGLDALLPAPRRLSTEELVAIGRVCAAHVHERVGPKSRSEFERLTALVDLFLADPVLAPGAGRRIPDLGPAARRDAEHARGPLKVAALVAWAASTAGVESARLVGEAARLAVKLLARDRDARDALLSELCARFR